MAAAADGPLTALHVTQAGLFTWSLSGQKPECPSVRAPAGVCAENSMKQKIRALLSQQVVGGRSCDETALLLF